LRLPVSHGDGDEGHGGGDDDDGSLYNAHYDDFHVIM